MKSRTLLQVLVLRMVLLLGIVVLWEYAAGGFGLGAKWADPLILSRPSLILTDLGKYVDSGLFAKDMQISLSEAFLGLLLGAVGGIAVGLFFGYWRRVAAVFDPIMVALLSLPRITVAPILILWFGLGMPSKVVLSLFTVFFVMFFNTYLGVRNVDPELVKVVKMMGGGRSRIARMVIVPTVSSWIFAALRPSVGFALTGAIVGEFVGSSSGLGYRLLLASGLLNTDRVFSIMLILMTVGVSLVEISRRAEEYLLRWRPNMAQLG